MITGQSGYESLNGIMTDVACLFFLGLTSVPRDIPENTLMIDLQNNDITEIKEDDFKKLSNLYVREMADILAFILLLVT